MDSNSGNMRHEWLVRMKVEGSVDIGKKINFNNVDFIQRKKWIEAAARVDAVSRDAAEKLAVRKVSDLINILAFVSNCSIKLVGVESRGRDDSVSPVTIRMINADEVERWKTIERSYDPELIRALAYYRKGLNEPDPFDAFLAFWTVLEIVCPENRRQTIANRIFSFARNHSIEINLSQVNDLRGTRNRIAHGSKQYDIDQIEYVSEKINKIRNLARQFLQAKMHRGS